MNYPDGFLEAFISQKATELKLKLTDVSRDSESHVTARSRPVGGCVYQT